MHILAATDGSDAAERAVDFAATLATRLGATLQILNVVAISDTPPQGLEDLARWEHMTPGEFRNAMSERILLSAAQRAKKLGVSDAQLASQLGDVAALIIDIAKTGAADVIVLGKRGLGRLPGLLLGSVSQKLVSVAPCAVIVVP
jgi:nucleotide-binding universal stress UspA family protein